MKSSSSHKQELIQEPIRTVDGHQTIRIYKKVKLVGFGSYSKCFLVKNVHSGGNYVAKIVPKDKIQRLESQKLIYEIKIHQQLSHENIVHLSHWFENAKYKFIFLEYCAQGSLEQKLFENGKFAEQQIQFYGRQMLASIDYLHSMGILHRDLKLSNFYVTDSNVLKLGDFGFACQLTYPGEKRRQSCGTPNFIAPEALGSFGYSYTADVWAVGVLLYRMRFGVCPFENQDVKITLERIKTQKYSFPAKSSISPQLKSLIEGILKINYDERFTLTQIKDHAFFRTSLSQRMSLSRLLRFANIGSKTNNTSVSRTNKVSVQKPPNQCETNKEIKEILKSKTTLHLQTQNSVLFQRTQVKDPQSPSNGGLTVCFGSFFQLESPTKKDQRKFKLQNLVSSKQITSPSMKETAKNQRMLAYKQPLRPQTTSPNAQLILNLMSRSHMLPYHVQLERDIYIIHYTPSLKQVLIPKVTISRGKSPVYKDLIQFKAILAHRQYKPVVRSEGMMSVLVFRSKEGLFDMNGAPFQGVLPKVAAYVIRNNVAVDDIEKEEVDTDQTLLRELKTMLPAQWTISQQGIRLSYKRDNGTIGACYKFHNQCLFYLCPDERTSILYSSSLQFGSLKIAENQSVAEAYKKGLSPFVAGN